MFKSLRDRLKGVSDRLEDELEAKLEAELDAELAAQMGETSAEPPESADEPARGGSHEAGAVEEAPSEPGPTRAAEATPEPEAGQVAEPEPTSSAQATPEPEAGQAEPASTSAAEATPESKAGATEDKDEAVQDQAQKSSPAGGTAPSAVPDDSVPDAEVPLHAEQEEAVQPDAPKAAKAPTITGRKMLSDEEIEARLARELDEAVEVQKEVETVVQQSGQKMSRYTINEDVLEEILWELEIGLLESDVALPVIEAIKDNVKEQLLAMSVAGKSAHDVVEKVLRSAVRRVLNVGHFDFDAFVNERLAAGKRPVVVMFVGVNGTGKTTSIGRIAYRLKQNGISCVLAAGDTFRAGAIEQLSQHGDRLGVKVVKHSAGADPAAVAYDAVEHAKARRKDVVLLDTAGRMQTNTNLMDEMDKIRRVANPDLTVFVGDSLAGNDAVEQARRFDEVVDIDGAILTKTDVDAKGGAALSVAYTINKPLLFVGVGQDYPDLRPFDAGWMVDRLFGAEGDE